MGFLVGLVSLMAMYYVAAGAFILAGSVFALSGLARLYQPELWDKLVALGILQMDGSVGEFFNQLSASGQCFLLLVFASVFIASGVAMLWLGKYLLRGLRFLFSLVFDWATRLTQAAKRAFQKGRHRVVPVGKGSLGFEGGLE